MQVLRDAAATFVSDELEKNEMFALHLVCILIFLFSIFLCDRKHFTTVLNAATFVSDQLDKKKRKLVKRCPLPASQLEPINIFVV